MLCKDKIDFGEVWDHFCKAIFTLKSDTLASPVALYEVHKPPKILFIIDLGRYQNVILIFFAHFFMLCKAKIDFGEV